MNQRACIPHRQAPRSSASSILGVPGEHESGNDGQCRGVSSIPSRILISSAREPHRIHAVCSTCTSNFLPHIVTARGNAVQCNAMQGSV